MKTKVATKTNLAGFWLWSVHTDQDHMYDGHLWIATRARAIHLALRNAETYIKANRRGSRITKIEDSGYIDA